MTALGGNLLTSLSIALGYPLTVMSRGLREFDYKINTEHIPPCVWNGERLKLTNWRVLPRFSPEAEIASTYILANVPRYLGPPVVPGH